MKSIGTIMIENRLQYTPFPVLAKVQRTRKKRVKYALFMTVFPPRARFNRNKKCRSPVLAE